MREYQHRHAIRTLFYSPTMVIILFLITILLLRSIIDLNDKRIAVSNSRKESEIKKQSLQDSLVVTQTKNDSIHTARGFEEYVRVTQPVVKDGEGVIVVYDSQRSPVTPVRKETNIWEDLIILFQKVIYGNGVKNDK